jgi:hypothetical protein
VTEAKSATGFIPTTTCKLIPLFVQGVGSIIAGKTRGGGKVFGLLSVRIFCERKSVSFYLSARLALTLKQFPNSRFDSRDASFYKASLE